MASRLAEWQQSRTVSLAVVTMALVLDTLLLTAIVPMLPHWLNQLRESNATSSENSSISQNASAMHPNELADFSSIISEGFSNMSTKIGMLLASKMFFEIVAAPFFGMAADRLGYTLPMLIGFVLTFISTLIFAFTEKYLVLFVARSVQGLGSAAIFSPGMGLLAEKYSDDTERANAISIAYGGIIFGVIIGPVFGGAMYQMYGKTAAFSIVAVIALFGGVSILFIAEPKRAKKEKVPSMKALLIDPYILIALGGVFFLNFGYSVFETLLPMWMMTKMNATSTEQGLAFLPTFLTLLLALNTLNRLSLRIERYFMAITGLILKSLCLIVLPLATTQIQLILPSSLLGLAIGLMDCSVIPYFAYLVDLRHKSHYGTVYALNHCVYCLGYMVGASLAGTLEPIIKFGNTLCVAGIAGVLYAPFLLFLRNPSSREEKPPREALPMMALHQL